jgi:hypothetical protein
MPDNLQSVKASNYFISRQIIWGHSEKDRSFFNLFLCCETVRLG